MRCRGVCTRTTPPRSNSVHTRHEGEATGRQTDLSFFKQHNVLRLIPISAVRKRQHQPSFSLLRFTHAHQVIIARGAGGRWQCSSSEFIHGRRERTKDTYPHLIYLRCPRSPANAVRPLQCPARVCQAGCRGYSSSLLCDQALCAAQRVYGPSPVVKFSQRPREGDQRGESCASWIDYIQLCDRVMTCLPWSSERCAAV